MKQDDRMIEQTGLEGTSGGHQFQLKQDHPETVNISKNYESTVSLGSLLYWSGSWQDLAEVSVEIHNPIPLGIDLLRPIEVMVENN